MRAVMKFGGGVLTNEDSYKQIIKILQNNTQRQNILVVSAHSGITDLLFETLENPSKKNVQNTISQITCFPICVIHRKI